MKTLGDNSRQGGESPDEKKSVAIQKRKVRQKSHKINQICMKYHQLTLADENKCKTKKKLNFSTPK